MHTLAVLGFCIHFYNNINAGTNANTNANTNTTEYSFLLRLISNSLISDSSPGDFEPRAGAGRDAQNPNQLKMTAPGAYAVVSIRFRFAGRSQAARANLDQAHGPHSGQVLRPDVYPGPAKNSGVRLGCHRFLLVRGFWATPDWKRTPNPSQMTAYDTGAVSFAACPQSPGLQAEGAPETNRK
jgi:hypothetical protein